MRTPAQVTGRYDFVEDVPVQGPTDEGIRAADCWWTQNVLPVKNPACADCKGPVPLWAKNPTVWGGGWPEYGGNGGPNCAGSVRYGSRQVAGFSLDGAGDLPATLAGDQQAWVTNTLRTLNQRIVETTGTSCASWQDPGANLAAAVGCFQIWINANGKGLLRTDGVLDRDTLHALISVTKVHSADFPASFPHKHYREAASEVAPEATSQVPTAPVPETPPVTAMARVEKKAHEIQEELKEKTGLSTGAMVGIGVGAVVVVGGIAYAATRTTKKPAAKTSKVSPAASEARRRRSSDGINKIR